MLAEQSDIAFRSCSAFGACCDLLTRRIRRGLSSRKVRNSNVERSCIQKRALSMWKSRRSYRTCIQKACVELRRRCRLLGRQYVHRGWAGDSMFRFTKWELASANGKLQSTLQWQWPSSGADSSMGKVLGLTSTLHRLISIT